MKDWQKGIELDRLKEIAAPFKSVHKPLVFGAFGLTKERDVATAISKKRCLWTDGATLIWSRLNRGGSRTDFRGEKFKFPNGSVLIGPVAAQSMEAGRKLFEKLVEFSKGRKISDRLFLEIFEEDTNARNLAQEFGFAWKATKISAGSEVYGIYQYGVEESSLPHIEAATLECLADDFLSGTELETIREELRANSPFAQHYSSYNKRKSWTAFSLFGYDDDPAFIIKPHEMSAKWKKENANRLKDKPRPTSAFDSFPTAISVAQKFVENTGQIDRVRFMALSAKKGELARHADITDREAGVASGKIVRLHIPIYSSESVTVFGWNHRGTVHEKKFLVAGLYYLDQRKPHSVVNKGGQSRVHFVCDVRMNPKCEKLFPMA